VQEERVLLVRCPPLLLEWPDKDTMVLLMYAHHGHHHHPLSLVLPNSLLVTSGNTCLFAGLAASASSLMTTSAPVDQAVAMAATAPTLRAAVTALPAAAGG
jgi:hypothetical protein